MNGDRILITGATGQTGSKTIELLLQRGHVVRALVHSRDERSAALEKAGAEVVEGDLLDFASVRSAFDGVRSAYFVYPIAPGILDATAYVAQSAREAGTRSVVNISQASARRDSKSHAARDHWISERVFDWSALAVTHLRPTLFAEWMLYFAPFIQAGTLRLPMRTGVHAPIAAEDQASVIAAILADPEPHAGKTYYLYGPAEMSFAQMAREMSRVLGRPVDYEVTDAATLRKAYPEVTGRDFDDFLWQHFGAIAHDHDDGIFAGTNDVVERIGGKAPMTFAEFVEKHRAALTPPA